VTIRDSSLAILQRLFIQEEYPDGYKGHVLTDNDKQTLLASAVAVHARFISNQVFGDHQAGFSPASFLNSQLGKLYVTLPAASVGVTPSEHNAPDDYLVTLGEHSTDSLQQQLQMSVHRVSRSKKRDATGAEFVGEEAIRTPIGAPQLLRTSCNYRRGDLVFSTVVNGRTSVVQLVEANESSSTYRLSYLGSMFDIDVHRPLQRAALDRMPPPRVVDTSRYIVSPMPGAVFSVAVAVGDEVVPGEEMCVIEAMKMQNALRAQRAGKIKAVRIKKGSTVAADDILIEFE